jgi:hypothetical protein
VCSASAPCFGQGAQPAAPCGSNDACRAASPTVEALAPPTPSVGGGNVPAPETRVGIPRRATRAELLAKTLRVCRKRHRGHRRRCEAAARRKFGRVHTGRNGKRA